MGAAVFTERASLAIGVLLALAGAAVAWSSPNLTKRLVAICVSVIGAIVALAVLGAPQALLAAAAATGFAYAALGAALSVRAQESYDGVEAPDLDAADAADEKRPSA